jgi:hypothetical protein
VSDEIKKIETPDITRGFDFPKPATPPPPQQPSEPTEPKKS